MKNPRGSSTAKIREKGKGQRERARKSIFGKKLFPFPLSLLPAVIRFNDLDISSRWGVRSRDGAVGTDISHGLGVFSPHHFTAIGIGKLMGIHKYIFRQPLRCSRNRLPDRSADRTRFGCAFLRGLGAFTKIVR